ncbi:hypothetical protein M8818_007717 [Zalaria obscura]|uniref:Uncharacterized protein n=1 Tax=Zalaria obscura TaxID=2024903 RepID=A0ACC3S3X3_9PEZI
MSLEVRHHKHLTTLRSFLTPALHTLRTTFTFTSTPPSTSTPTGPAAHNRPTFLSLPPEIRQAIYEAIVHTHPTRTAILLTSRQISMEAQPALYTTPVVFRSQHHLFSWLARSNPRHLRRVRSLRLAITDVDISRLLDDRAPPASRPSLAELYAEEICRFDDALRALPNLVALTVVEPRGLHSKLLRELYKRVLQLIPRRLPRLRELAFAGEARTARCDVGCYRKLAMCGGGQRRR